MSTVALLKDLLYLTLRHGTCFKIFEKVKVISLCWFTVKEWDLCKCFCALNAVLIATSSVEYKRAPLKEQSQNCFPEINIFSIFFSNQPQTAYNNGCRKMCCEINTSSLTWGFLQVLP